MNNSNKSDEKSVLVGMAIGALLGVAAGVLFAPTSGDRMRKRIKKVALGASKDATVLHKTAKKQLDGLQNQVMEYANRTVDSLEATAKEQVNSVVTKAATIKGNASEAVKQKVEEAQSTAKAKVNETRDSVLTATETTAQKIAQVAQDAKVSTPPVKSPKRFKGV